MLLAPQLNLGFIIIARFILALVLATPLSTLRGQTTAEDRVEQSIQTRRAHVASIFQGEGITDDWFGYGPTMRENGIKLAVRFTYFGQSAVTSYSDTGIALGGKLDGLLNFDLSKINLWPGLTLTVHSEFNFGEASNGVGGTLLPVNVALQLPGISSQLQYDTASLFLKQRFNDTFTLLAGKTNLVDIAAIHPFSGGLGLTQFMNGGLASAPNGALPPYVYFGSLLAKTKWAVFNLTAYGGTSAQGKLSFGDAFDQGWLLSAGISVPVTPWGLSGHQSLNGLWGKRDASSLSSLGDLLAPTDITGVNERDTQRYVLTYAFDQYFLQWGEKNERGCGFWGRATLGDNELTAIAWSVAGGVGGTSPIPGRDRDRWGIGFFHYALADFLKDPSISSVPLNDEHGVECFYNCALTGWLSMTADVQVIDPALASQNAAVFVALRTLVKF